LPAREVHIHFLPDNALSVLQERILKLQEKKQLVFDGTVGGDAGSLQRLTVDDLRFLFTAN
jgi:SNF2 family DNA or RNA helicase